MGKMRIVRITRKAIVAKLGKMEFLFWRKALEGHNKHNEIVGYYMEKGKKQFVYRFSHYGNMLHNSLYKECEKHLKKVA